MKKTIEPGERFGEVKAPASKSVCHRLLILTAFGERSTVIDTGEISADISATIACLEAMGAQIIKEDNFVRITPIKGIPEGLIHLNCGESGSTLRFLLPMVGVIGADAVFHLDGRLSKRPVAPLINELKCNGMSIEVNENTIFCRGKLKQGNYTIPGNLSSQYISALLMALPLLNGDSNLSITGSVQSEPYIELSMELLKYAGIKIYKTGRDYVINGSQRPKLPESIAAEGDYSSAAFFLCAGALSQKGIKVGNLNKNSVQGDREIIAVLKRMGADIEQKSDTVTARRGRLTGTVIDAAQIPDLVPVLSAVAALSDGETRIVNAERLRFKESDRLSTTRKMLSALGADIVELQDGLVIHGKEHLKGGLTESFGDHRIAMAAAVTAIGCENAVIIDNAEAVGKSYPGFWWDFQSLGREKR